MLQKERDKIQGCVLCCILGTLSTASSAQSNTSLESGVQHTRLVLTRKASKLVLWPGRKTQRSQGSMWGACMCEFHSPESCM